MHLLATVGLEEVDCLDRLQTLALPCDLGEDFRRIERIALAFSSGEQCLGLVRQLRIVLFARALEERADVAVGEPFDSARLEDQTFAAELADLAQDPREILARGIGAGQPIERVLEGNRSDLLQPPPDFHAGVRRLGGEGESECQPACAVVGHDGVSVAWIRSLRASL